MFAYNRFTIHVHNNKKNNNNKNIHISKFSITMQDPRLPDFFQVMVQTTCEK